MLELQFCNEETITTLSSSITRYIDQLSLVFSKKENLRSKTWWLSAFYSLIIQSMVRKLLLSLVNSFQLSPLSNIKQYLHLAIRLFIASSRKHDPLVHDWSGSDSIPLETIQDYETVKFSVRQDEWISTGSKNSGEFLQRVFEDDGLLLHGKTEGLMLPPLKKISAISSVELNSSVGSQQYAFPQYAFSLLDPYIGFK